MTNRADGYSLARFGLNSRDASRLAGFYEEAFSAVILSCEREDSYANRCAASCIVIKLGESTVEIRQFDDPGELYPGELSPYDPRFQHLAIVVTAMPLAMQRLMRMSGWAPISTDGPQTLPASAGSVVAFKFRDPDGHPLELLEFPPGRVPSHWAEADDGMVFQGIDHSAISVQDIEPSIEFYQSLGLAQVSRTLNEGIEQQRLDGILDPHVDVIGLAPPTPTPHVELLHYRTALPPPASIIAFNDVAATRLVFTKGTAPDATRGTLRQDADGHFIELRD